MKAKLDQLRRAIVQATVTPSIHQDRPPGSDPTYEFLTAESTRLEKELVGRIFELLWL